MCGTIVVMNTLWNCSNKDAYLVNVDCSHGPSHNIVKGCIPHGLMYDLMHMYACRPLCLKALLVRLYTIYIGVRTWTNWGPCTSMYMCRDIHI